MLELVVRVTGQRDPLIFTEVHHSSLQINANAQHTDIDMNIKNFTNIKLGEFDGDKSRCTTIKFTSEKDNMLKGYQLIISNDTSYFLQMISRV